MNDIDFQELSDAELWEYFKQGSEDAFTWIYKNNFTSLFRYGKQITFDECLIEDTIQDLFIVLKTNKEHLGAVRSIKAYLFASFRRLIFRYKKKTTVELTEGYRFELVPPLESIIIDDDLYAERKAKLQKALGRLTIRQREAIYYFYFENMSYEEVQQVMHFDNIKSSRNLIYEALKVLRECILYCGTFFIPSF